MEDRGVTKVEVAVRFDGQEYWGIVGEADVIANSPESMTLGVVDLLRYLADDAEQFVKGLREVPEND